MQNIIGSGFHGEVWSLFDQPDKVVKLAWAPIIDQDYHPKWTWQHIHNTYQYLIQHPSPTLATIYEVNVSVRIPHTNRQYYSVLMEKLLPLTDDELKVMTSVVMDYNGNIESGKCLQHIQELQEWLEFDAAQAEHFYDSLVQLPVVQRDFHSRNIMKDKEGEFRLIDFECLDLKDKEKQDVS